MRSLFILISTLFFTLTFSLPAQAHVVVTPEEAPTGRTVVFTISVPNEKESPTSGLRLVMPEGVTEVTPTVKSGWDIVVKREAKNDEEIVKEIIWTNGLIPPERRDEFSFSAKLPEQATALAWKAYQTHRDGTVEAWDQQDTGSADNANTFSVTQVRSDLKQSITEPAAKTAEIPRQYMLYAGVAGGVLLLIALLLLARRR